MEPSPTAVYALQCHTRCSRRQRKVPLIELIRAYSMLCILRTHNCLKERKFLVCCLVALMEIMKMNNFSKYVCIVSAKKDFLSTLECTCFGTYCTV